MRPAEEKTEDKGLKVEGKLKLEDFLYKFRRCSNVNSLERLKDKLEYELPASDSRDLMRRAAAHRRAEILVGRYFDQGEISPELLQFVSTSP